MGQQGHTNQEAKQTEQVDDTRMLNQAKRESYKNTPVYMFGFQVPRNHAQAMAIDKENGNTKWADSEKAEKDQLVDYETFSNKDPEAITNQLMDIHKFKLKRMGKINYLLRCDYYRDKGGCLCMRPKKYIEKMMLTYVRLFGEQPKEYQSLLEPNDTPELGTSELLDLPGIKTFQSMIGACQWIIQLGRFDIAVHIMSMGSFRTAPRVGHLEHMKRIYGYLMRFKTGTIRIMTGIPDFSDLKYEQHDWSRSAYAGAKELIPDDITAHYLLYVQKKPYLPKISVI